MAAVGLDYLSGSLWDKYATVMARQSPSKAFAVLRRAVAVPCNKVAELFQKCVFFAPPGFVVFFFWTVLHIHMTGVSWFSPHRAEGLSSSIVTEEVVSAGELLDLTSRVEAENPGCSAGVSPSDDDRLWNTLLCPLPRCVCSLWDWCSCNRQTSSHSLFLCGL